MVLRSPVGGWEEPEVRKGRERGWRRFQGRPLRDQEGQQVLWVSITSAGGCQQDKEKEGVSRRKARGLGSRDLMRGPHSSLWGGRWEAAGTDGEKRRVTSSYLPKRDLCQLQVAEFIWIDNFQWKFPPSPEIRAWQIKHMQLYFWE